MNSRTSSATFSLSTMIASISAVKTSRTVRRDQVAFGVELDRAGPDLHLLVDLLPEAREVSQVALDLGLGLGRRRRCE